MGSGRAALLPPWPERSPRPVSDRLCLPGILFVLRNDIARQLLPPGLGFGSGQICRRRLDRWHRPGRGPDHAPTPHQAVTHPTT
ncbi:transposase [Streptomyces sp. AM 2-1-1]|uniref:transposase n=1 Tax=Streptomyces sp. AM 2-1-1 TaxID=3028709 RepID=UPI0023B8B32F|nr:transposase [Streptomyces sp. AM 2-1-1]WEH38825.1 transposase [Streptomyces sp. AM 2-1-1]